MLLRDFARMSPEEKQVALTELVRRSSSPLPNEWINGELAKLESQYGMSTDEMREAFRRGEVDDTPDIARWLVLSEAVDK